MPDAASPDRLPVASTWITRSIRKVLWVGVPFNLLVAAMLAFPGAFGELLPPLPVEFYRWMLICFVLVFGATYAWLAVQPTIPHALVGLASLGKIGVFGVSLACLLREEIELRTLLVSLVDLSFAAYFLAWMRASLAAGTANRPRTD
jgi:hypothetical protein